MRIIPIALSTFPLALPGALQALSIKDSTVFGRPTDLITWIDARGLERKAALVKAGDHTGIIQFFRYRAGADPVTVTPGDPNADPLNSGFGSSCHHGATHYVQGTLSRRWQGAAMAVYDWVHAIDGATETITYAFRDGQDYFQWSETMDTRGGTKPGDSRGPYCTLNWDGTGGPAEGVEYGAKHYFKQPALSGSGYPNRTGPWTFGGTCDIPYAWEWAHGREIGYVATQTFAQQHQGVPAWSDALPASGTGIDPSGDQVWRTDYQMNFYDQWMKITWGQPYGWTDNTADANAPGCLKDGWGQYSLSIVLDARADSGVMRLRDENRAIHSGQVAFAAATGAVKARGPVGIANPALQDLSPPGYDHNYRAWWVDAAGGQARVSLDLAAGATLLSPCFRISGMAAAPARVSRNGQDLEAGKGFYAAYDAARQEAWVVVAGSLAGKNALEFAPAGSMVRARAHGNGRVTGPAFRADGARLPSRPRPAVPGYGRPGA